MHQKELGRLYMKENDLRKGWRPQSNCVCVTLNIGPDEAMEQTLEFVTWLSLTLMVPIPICIGELAGT